MRIAMVCSPIVEWHESRLVPAYMDSYKNNPHLAPYLMAAMIRQGGFEVSMVDLTCVSEINEGVTDRFGDYQVILLSCNSTNWPTARLLIQWLKAERPDQKIVLGGIHATLFGEDLIERFPIDYLVVGEGEKVILPLLRALQSGKGLEEVPGLIFKRANQVVRTPLPALLTSEELDQLPVPLYSEMPPHQFKTIAIESSRGCKGSCAFCSIPFRKVWRPISATAFVEKILVHQQFLENVDIEHYSIVDDCFTIDKGRAIAIADQIERRGLKFKAYYDARIKDFLDEELVDRLAPYTRGVLLGAESFLPETLRLIGKPISPQDLVACARILHRRGLAESTIFSFIIGFPWETKEQVRENIKKIVDLAFNYGIKIFLQWHTLTPGSALWDKMRRVNSVAVTDLDEVGYLIGEKWFYASSSLTVDERLEISDMVTSVQKVMVFTKPFESQEGTISFMIPPFLLGNKHLTSPWCENYF